MIGLLVPIAFLEATRFLPEIPGHPAVEVVKSSDGGATWGTPTTLIRDDALPGTDQARMLGRRSDEDIYALYRAADLYVSFSRHEGFGMPLVEAMAFDLPVLAHSAGGTAATLGSGGLILSDATPESMASAG